MTERELSAADAALRERIRELSVHIPCGGLRGPVHGRWQSCRDEDSPERWEDCDVSREKDLCIICFKATAGGKSRWSWLACADCRRVNESVARLESQYGDRPFALGRHSLMNRIGVCGGAPPEVQEEQIARLTAFAKGDDRLREWRSREYSRLASQFDPLADVSLRVGRANRHPASRRRWTPSRVCSGMSRTCRSPRELRSLNRGAVVNGCQKLTPFRRANPLDTGSVFVRRRRRQPVLAWPAASRAVSLVGNRRPVVFASKGTSVALIVPLSRNGRR